VEGGLGDGSPIEAEAFLLKQNSIVIRFLYRMRMSRCDMTADICIQKWRDILIAAPCPKSGERFLLVLPVDKPTGPKTVAMPSGHLKCTFLIYEESSRTDTFENFVCRKMGNCARTQVHDAIARYSGSTLVTVELFGRTDRQTDRQTEAMRTDRNKAT